MFIGLRMRYARRMRRGFSAIEFGVLGLLIWAFKVLEIW